MGNMLVKPEISKTCFTVWLSPASAISPEIFLNCFAAVRSTRKPALLIPYHSGRGDQLLNANSLKARGLAHVMAQSDLTAQSLPPALDALWEDRALLTQRLSALPDADGTKLVLDQIHKYAKP